MSMLKQLSVFVLTVIYLTSSRVTSTVHTECPDDFSYVSSVNGCYKAVKRWMNWADAAQNCQSLHSDAHLVVIDDAEEQSALAEWLPEADREGDGWDCWTAGQRRDPNSLTSPFIWRAGDVVSEMSYTNWYRGQPDNAHGLQACMYSMKGRSYEWADAACSYRQSSVCELDMTPTSE